MRWIAPLALAGLAAVAAPALTARVAPPAGIAVGGVSGYRVTKVSYDLDATRITGVSFALAPPHAASLRVRIGRSRAGCHLRRGRATCRFGEPLPRLEDARSLAVAAAG
jgi:hypothetical protein